MKNSPCVKYGCKLTNYIPNCINIKVSKRDLWLPIKPNIEEAWNKTLTVIESCQTEEQDKTACNYLDNFIKMFKLQEIQKDIYVFLIQEYNGRPFTRNI
jgi:hypothetical protein